MVTLDDTPMAAGQPPENTPHPEFGVEVQEMLTAAASSPRVRMQTLGTKAQTALDNLATALKREEKIAAAEAELARLKRGED